MTKWIAGIALSAIATLAIACGGDDRLEQTPYPHSAALCAQLAVEYRENPRETLRVINRTLSSLNTKPADTFSEALYRLGCES